MEFIKKKLNYSPELEILEKINEHATYCTSAVKELVKAIDLVMRDRDDGADFESVSEKEERADEIRRDIVKRLAKGILPPLSKEDFIRLTLALDKVANYAKESAEMLQLVNSEKLPADLKKAFIVFAQLAEKAASVLTSVICVLQEDTEKALERCLEVEECESKVDDQYLKT
ncbi:MAG: DUF47 domain-containing protein, partial [Thermoproteota archaeon]